MTAAATEAQEPSLRPKFSVNAKLFALVAQFRAPSAFREAIKGVLIEPHPDGGAILVACDGYQIAVAHDPEGATNGAHIVAITDPLLSACAHRAPGSISVRSIGRRVGVVIKFNGETKEVHIQAGAPAISGRYPDWKRIIVNDAADFAPGLSGALNVALMKRIVGVAALMKRLRLTGNKTLIGVRHWQKSGSLGLVITRFDAPVNLLVGTMPMTDKGMPDEPLPAFFSAIQQGAK